MMVGKNYNSWVEVNLDYLAYNIEKIRTLLEPNCDILAVVKSNACGNGAIEVAKFLINECGISQLALANVWEGIELREAGIDVPILVLGGIPDEQIEEAVKNDLSITLFRIDTAKSVSNLSERLHKKTKAHIKIDTGLGRIGVKPGEELQELITAVKDLQGLNIEGVFTHFAEAGAIDKSYTLMQLNKFKDAIDRLKYNDINPKYIHCANTQAVLEVPESHFNLVRVGKAMYGYHGLDHKFTKIDLKPVTQWKTVITYIKYVLPGESISYSRTYTASTKRKIATLALGFGDGYNSLLSNKGIVIVKGKKAPIVGRVCMDQCCIDISNIEDVKIGDIVTVLGIDKDEKIDLSDISNITGAQLSETLSNIGRRVARTYVSSKIGINH